MTVHRASIRLTFAVATLLIAASSQCNASQVPSLRSPSPRIVGGLPATDVHIPYIVSLVTYNFHSCGGSIVNERTVITAAHCLAYTTARLLKVHAGAKTRSLAEGILVSVSAIHSHPGWTSDVMDNDIGIVRLQSPLVFSETIQPISLPADDYVVRDGSYATVAGWGFTSVMGPGSDVLRYARVPVINQGLCNRLMGGRITDRMICAGSLNGGVDACTMDSGGPLVVGSKLVGIVSWGIGCALPNRPGVYARVMPLIPWVEEIMEDKYNEIL